VGIKDNVRDSINKVLAPFRHTLVDNRMLYEWQQPSFPAHPGFKPSSLPTGALEYLTVGNPRLADLRKRYAGFDNAVTSPAVWTDDLVSADDIRYFRGDNAYVWQIRDRGMNALSYALTTYYARSIDSLGLLQALEEDDSFGVHSFMIADRRVSRDLLDSVSEIYFLEKHLGISTRSAFSVLDIGAGYGRLAHRMTSALPNVRYFCTDAFAISTFLSEYYLRYRGLQERATVLPLDEVEANLARQTIDLAVNIHSFSECKPSAIDWWVSRIATHKVRYLMIVPNTGDRLLTHEDVDFGAIVEKHGYRLKVKEPKYRDPVVQQYGINPSYYFLFELEPGAH
jgi:hypothetical protein